MMMVLAMVLSAQPALPVIERRRPAQEAEAMPSVEAVPEPDSAPAAKEEPLPDVRSLFGEWRLGMARGGRSCVLRLEQTDMGFGLYSLWQSANCPEGLFSVTRWRLAGATLQLLDRNGRAHAALTLNDARWQGKRSSDGAAIQLDRLR